MSNLEHPFAPFIQTLGRGKRGSRALTQQQAYDAMSMILAEQVQDVQLGAFLMLMRVKEETPAEVAGFTQAVTAHLAPLLSDINQTIDLDWPSYAGKRRHLPWFVLAALLLAENGIKILMHGASGHTQGRLYTEDALATLGIPSAASIPEAMHRITQHHFAFLPLRILSPKLQALIDLRPMLGLRSPVHTVARMINPCQAPYSMQGIFHPGYLSIHQQAGQQLNQYNLISFRGDGGESECRPDNNTVIHWLKNGELLETDWPALVNQRQTKDDNLALTKLIDVWRGTELDSYGHNAIISTAGLALHFTERAKSVGEAIALAEQMWSNRSKEAYPLSSG